MSRSTEDETRHGHTVSHPLKKGNRIPKSCVARALTELGTRQQSAPPEADAQPEVTPVVAVTQPLLYDDVMRALLYSPTSGRWLRASRRNISSARSQRETDWTVHEAGDTLLATGGDIKFSPNVVIDADTYAAEWLANIAWSYVGIAAEEGNTTGVSDILTLTNPDTIRLKDATGREGVARFQLTDQQSSHPTPVAVCNK
jgi:hypothetical protein